jgi:hypothetical protein
LHNKPIGCSVSGAYALSEEEEEEEEEEAGEGEEEMMICYKDKSQT